MGRVTLKLRCHPHHSESAMAGTEVSVSEMDANLSQRHLPRLAETKIRAADGEHAATILRAIRIVPGSILRPYERGAPVGRDRAAILHPILSRRRHHGAEKGQQRQQRPPHHGRYYSRTA